MDQGGDVRAGRVLGERFELVDELPERGPGVWRARRRDGGSDGGGEGGRDVVARRLNPCDGPAAEARARWLDGLARLDAPNLVRVQGTVADGADLWLITDLIAGTTLAQRVRRVGPMPEAEVVAFGRELAGGLGAAHWAEVVWECVEPAAVLLGDDGVARLDVRPVQPGDLAASPARQVPELARGGAPSTASDVFLLGSVLYTAKQGRPPFPSAPDPAAFTQTVASGAIRPPDRAVELLPVLHQLHQLDPKHRPSAADAAALLDGAAARLRGARTTPVGAATTVASPVAAAAVTLPPIPLAQLAPDLAGGAGPSRPATMPMPPGPIPSGASLPPTDPPAPRRRRVLRVVVVVLAVLALVAAGGAASWLIFGRDNGSPPPAAATPPPPPGPRVGDARAADPCGLVRPAALARYGQIELLPDFSDLDTCALDVTPPGAPTPAVRLLPAFVDPYLAADITPLDRVGTVAISRPEGAPDGCTRAIVLPDGNAVEILALVIESQTSPFDPCALADAGLSDALATLVGRGVPERSVPLTGGLAALDACAVASPAALAAIPGLDESAVHPGFGRWSCRWGNPGGNGNTTTASVRFSRTFADNPGGAIGQPRTISDRTAFAFPSSSGCGIHVLGREFAAVRGGRHVELLNVSVQGGGLTGDVACAVATAFATALAPSIPR